MKYFIGILGIIVGAVLVIKTEWFVQNFGTIEWAEAHLGYSGGTRLMYKLIGLAFILLSLMGMTGLLGAIILKLFGPLFGGLAP
jgi:hypothetical protein